MPERLKIGEILVRTGLIQEGQLRAALGEQQRWGGRVGITLVKMGFLREDDLVRALGSHFGVPVVRLAGKRIAPEVLALLPREFCDKHGCMLLFVHWEEGGEVAYLGMEDPGDLAVLDDVSFRTGLQVRPVLVGPLQLRAALREFFGDEDADLPARPGDSIPAARPDPAAAAKPVSVVPPDPALAATPVSFAPPAAPGAVDPEDATQTFDERPVDAGYEQTFDAIGNDLIAEAAEGADDVLGPDEPSVDPYEQTSVEPPAAVAPAPPAQPRVQVPVQAPAASIPSASQAGLTHAGLGADPERPRQVATRGILRAVTRLMIQKGLITREELLEAVRAERGED